MTTDDVTILRRLLGEEYEAKRLDEKADQGKSEFQATYDGGRSTGITTAVTAIRAALPILNTQPAAAGASKE